MSQYSVAPGVSLAWPFPIDFSPSRSRVRTSGSTSEASHLPADSKHRWALVVDDVSEASRFIPFETTIRKNGDVMPTILIDGFVAGTWWWKRRRDVATLEAAPFVKLTRAAQSQLRREAEVVDGLERDAASSPLRNRRGPDPAGG